jgi:K+-sensing histidine kinase KdpD
MIADWKLYEGILFNLIQNALKYNKPVEGDIVMTITCKPMKKQKKDTEKLYILET